MCHYQKARATRIWQDDLGNEYESPVRFLWDDVTRLEGPEGIKGDSGLVRFQNTQPKTVIQFADGTCICVLGKLEKWDERWDNYLNNADRRAALTYLN